MRDRVRERDGSRCVRCGEGLGIKEGQVDHIIPVSRGGLHRLSNLRLLCRRCHVLRKDNSHRGMIANALKDGVIPPDWRGLVW